MVKIIDRTPCERLLHITQKWKVSARVITPLVESSTGKGNIRRIRVQNRHHGSSMKLGDKLTAWKAKWAGTELNQPQLRGNAMRINTTRSKGCWWPTNTAALNDYYKKTTSTAGVPVSSTRWNQGRAACSLLLILGRKKTVLGPVPHTATGLTNGRRFTLK